MPPLTQSLPSPFRGTLAVLALLSFGCSRSAEAAPSTAPVEPGVTEVALWPDVAPGSQGLALKESITERSTDPLLHDRFVHGVVRPRLLVFRAAKPNGTGVIITPGGGYVREVLDKEGFETARWLAARGISAFVLLYRLPGEGHTQRAEVPLQDAQRAVRLVRGRAGEF